MKLLPKWILGKSKMYSKFDKSFLTGCDQNTEWMLEWFLSNYFRNNFFPMIISDFGMSPEKRSFIQESYPTVEWIDLSYLKENGWFKKPKSMISASKLSNQICWIDTDFQILSDISSVFDYVEPDKLCMVEDLPWSSRRKEKWHNSGIVAFSGCPEILSRWAKEIERNPTIGDQEVLHSMLRDPLTRMVYIKDLPTEYNWLRLHLLDGYDSPHKKTVHWTGRKGKEMIRSMMK